MFSGQRRDRAARDLGVVERDHGVTDDLAGLVSLAGEQHHVARTCPANRLGDRFAPVLHDNVIRIFLFSGVLHTRFDIQQNARRILGPWVVAGDDGAVCGRGNVMSMIEFRDSPWNARKRVQHPGTFNANPVSAAAGDAMLAMVATGEHHARADALNERLVSELNGVLERTGVPGVVYGLASYFHIALGQNAPRPQGGIEWPGPDAPPPMPGKLNVALKRALINHGVDLMGGSGGFVSGIHTDADIDHTIKAFEAAVGEMRAEDLV